MIFVMKIMKLCEIIGNKFHSGKCIYYKLIYRFIWVLRVQSLDTNYVIHAISTLAHSNLNPPIKGCHTSF